MLLELRPRQLFREWTFLRLMMLILHAFQGEEDFFANDDVCEGCIVGDQHKADQKKVGSDVLKAVDATPLMKNDLRSKFSLKKHGRPHKMIF